MSKISQADFQNPQLLQFLQDHLADLAPTAPAESRHALDVSALDNDDVRLWVYEQDGAILGTVALAKLTPQHEELKSMRTHPSSRGQGVASQLLRHALDDATNRGVTRVSLETGTMDFFHAARSMYQKHGFIECPPFGHYQLDPNSVFMTLSPL